MKDRDRVKERERDWKEGRNKKWNGIKGSGERELKKKRNGKKETE